MYVTGGELGFGRLGGGPITGFFCIIVLETNTGPGVVSYRIVSHRIVSYCTVSYRIVSYRRIAYCQTLGEVSWVGFPVPSFR